MSDRPVIAVVGSLNVDITLRVPRIPAPGETLTAHGLLTCFGGKGANQAVAAARAGAAVSLIGCVGPDDYGAQYTEHLRGEGIDTRGIVRGSLPTGTAYIAVDDHGENSIIVNPGANHALTPAHLETHADLIRGAQVILLQLECPLLTVLRAAQIAREAGVRIILNPSPWHGALFQHEPPVDVLIVNETEAAALGTEDPGKIGCESLIITRGGAPTRVRHVGQEEVRIAPPSVTPVDTVGAGDTFAGALATALASGTPLSESVSFANAAAALATLKPGAQTAIPHRDEILAFARRRSG